MMDTATPTKSSIDREKTAPFLMRAFVKVGGFHRPELFEDGTLPTNDEHQIFTWRDATLSEVVNSLRLTTNSIELRHPLAKLSFRALYADSAMRGRIASRDIGMVYSRDILGEPGTLELPAPRLLVDTEPENDTVRSLEDLRFIPGDYMCVSVALPKNVHTAAPDVSIRGAAGLATGPTGVNGWKSSRPLSPPGPPGGLGRGGGHWRGNSEPGGGRGRGGRGDRRRDTERDLGDRDRRVPPPRRGRDSPPPRRGRDRRSGSPPSRSRSPPPRRLRYD